MLCRYDPWVPANDTHGCVTGEEPACHAGDGGHGYSWSESELSDGFAQSNDGWYYVPVDSLMRLFATYSGCGAGNTVFGALFDTRNDPFTKTGSGQTEENLREKRRFVQVRMRGLIRR